MRSIVQRVLEANVSIDNSVVAKIDKGIAALIGFSNDDTDKDLDYIIDKILGLRIFEDDKKKMNLSLKDIKGELLIVPNFTLYGDIRKGKRPNFSSAAPPLKAEDMFAKFTSKVETNYFNDKLQFGIFQEDMKVSLVNDGPVTILLDSSKLF